MLSMILGFSQKDGNYYFENPYGIEPFIYALIGFLVVVAGIVILICIIWLLGLLMRKTNNLAFITDRKNKKKKNTPAEPESGAAAVPQPAERSDEIPDEVKAAIIAAIMAYYEEREEKCEFTVKRIKRL